MASIPYYLDGPHPDLLQDLVQTLGGAGFLGVVIAASPDGASFTVNATHHNPTIEKLLLDWCVRGHFETRHVTVTRA